MQVPGVGPSSQPSPNIPTPQQIEVSNYMAKIANVLETLCGDLKNGDLDAVKNDLQQLRDLFYDMSPITSGLSQKDYNLFVAMQSTCIYIWDGGADGLMSSYTSDPKSVTDYIESARTQALATSEFIRTGL